MLLYNINYYLFYATDDYRNCEMSPNCDVDKSKVDSSKELIPEQLEHNNEPSDESSVTLNNDLVRKTQQV